jgi:hypothetical protein
MKLKTPSELLELFPECEWNVREIGYLLMLGVVQGVKLPRTCLISVTSFATLLDYKKQFGRDKFILGSHTNVTTP